MTSALKYLALPVMASFLSIAGPAQAQQKMYAVDHWLNKCEAQQPAYTALAYSKLGISHCAKSNSIQRARNSAEDNCRQDVPRRLRKKASCELVAESGSVVNPTLFELLRQDVRMPVAIEIFDGDTNTKQTLSGHMVFNGARSTRDHLFQIEQAGGAVLCTGSYKQGRGQVFFDMRCFQKYRVSKKKAKQTGYFLYNGIYAPVFAPEMKFNQSYVKIGTPKPTVK